MPFSHEIYLEKRAIMARLTGTLTLAELVDGTKNLWADPGYSRDFCGIVDLRDASLGVAMDDYRALIDFLRDQKELSQAPWAAVARSPFATACAMIYRGALSKRHPFTVFSTWSAACQFLNVQLPTDLDDEMS